MVVVSAYSQNQFSATVVDAENGVPLIGAIINAGSNAVLTDENGQFVLESIDSESLISISYIGYEPIASKVSELGKTIAMVQAVNELNQIVVSADRDARERKDIPLAISLIPSRIIAETQPVALSELLNKVSGVNMIELGNEQHSMSVRQPISYKSVFLYLEDGLPIRPVGVFNHNALIEISMNSLRSVEVIRGAYSSLYGSDAIGGAINFITKSPSYEPAGQISIQGNNLGFKKLKFNASNTMGKLGVLVGGDYAYRRDGYRSHSDYDKLSLHGKVNYQFDASTKLVNSFSFVDYQTDMTGGLDSAYFFGENYSSQQTFTYRKVNTFRASSKLTHYWSDKDKTAATVFFRNNSIGQNPHYRIKDDYNPWSGSGDKNLAHSEINDNSFYSIGAIVHHQKKWSKMDSKLAFGASLDYSPNTYKANYIRVHKTDDKIYDSYTETDSVLTDYEVDLLNSGAYLQGEFSPIKRMKISAALRFDQFSYDYRNNLGEDAFSGAPDSKDQFNAFTPKLGITYDFEPIGLYGNYSLGFSPPEVGELYRGVKVPVLEPAEYSNYEIGGWASFLKKKLSIDLSYYYLIGQNEIINVKLDDGSSVNKNAGSTTHSGVEYNLVYNPNKTFSARFSGAYSKHEFDDFVEKGVDYSGNEMPGAPSLIANSEMTYRPQYLKGFHVGLEWQYIDQYYMDEKNTAEYEGYNLVNLRMGYKINGVALWFHVLNIADKLYATAASKTRWGVNYRPGEPRTFNVGVSYTIKGKK